MTSFERVRRTQRSLTLIVGSSVLFWAAAALLGMLALGFALNAAIKLPHIVAAAIPILAGVAAITTLGVLGWRSRYVWSFDRVALWIEERAPELRYALVTAIDPRYQGATAQLMESVVSHVDTAPFVRTAAKRSTLPALLALIVAVGLFAIVPKDWATVRAGGIFGPGARTAPIIGNRLVPLTGTLTPPAYARMKTETLNDPTVVSGLVGSQVVITGQGAPDGIEASLEVISEANTNVVVGDTAYDPSSEDVTSDMAPPTASSDVSPDENNGPGMGSPGMGSMGGNRGMGSGFGRHDNNERGGYPGMPGANGDPSSPYRINMPKKADSVGGGQQKARPKRPYVRQNRQTRLAQQTVVRKLDVKAGGKGWILAFALSDSNPGLIKLVDRQYHRQIIVDPRIDQPPAARLILPARDTTLRKIEGTLSLSATFSDDIGLGRAVFEWIKCSPGSSEEDVHCTKPAYYDTKEFGNAKSGDFAYSVPFASLKLEEGDQLSVRAIAWDNNNVTGPGRGVSETRTIRIARKSEYNKNNVNPAPPSADTAIQTLRMLIIKVRHLDTLYNVQHKIDRRPYEDSSIKLAGIGQGIQNKVDEIISAQTGGGEVPVNPLLALAKDSLWSGVRSLLVAETHESIPALVAAYNALREYSNAVKYYPPGIVPAPIINIERVRLQGKEEGLASVRTARPMADEDRQHYMQSYTAAIRQLQTSSNESAVESFQLLEVQTLRKYPELSKSIADVIQAVRTKKDPGPSLLQARLFLDDAPGTLDTLPLWSGAW